MSGHHSRSWSYRLTQALPVITTGLLVVVGAAPAYGEPASSVAPQTTLLHPNLARAADFGYSVAADGDTVIVGAPTDDTPETNSGSAHVYTRVGSQWLLQATLGAADHNTGDQFGYSVAIDGDTAVIGAAYDNSAGVAKAGAAYVFVRSGETWTQQAKLIPAGPPTFANAGWSVAVQGDLAVVTAPDESRSGAAYVFSRSGTVWTQRAVLRPQSQVEFFGSTADIDGDSIAIGVFRGLRDGDGWIGAVYVFTGPGYTRQLVEVPIVGDADFQSSTVAAISGDTLVVGADSDDRGGRRYQGAAYVYERRPGGTWALRSILLAPAGHANDAFGTTVDVDGRTAVVSAPEYAVPGGPDGSAFVYTRSGAGEFRLRSQLTPVVGESGQFYGVAAALSGPTLVVGAFRDGSGSAYVYSA